MVPDQSFFILQGWNITEQTGLVGALIVTLILCLINETLHAFICFAESINASRYITEGWIYSVTFQHCLMAFLHVFRVYVCCLLVMSLSTMNVWIILTLGLGSGVGYLLIRPLIFYLLHKHRTHNRTNNTTWTVISPEPLSSTPKSFSIPRLTMSRDLMEALRERRISKSLLSGTVGSADVSLQWDFTGNVTEDLEPNNWIRQSQWDGSLEMLDTGYVGGDSPDCSAVSFTMYVSVV